MLISPPAVFGACVSHDAQDRQLVFLIKRQHPIIEHISSGDGRLGGVELGMGNLGIGVDIGLLIDPPNALQGPT